MFCVSSQLTKPEASLRQAQRLWRPAPWGSTGTRQDTAVFRHIAEAVDPSTAKQLVAALDKIEALVGEAGRWRSVAAQAKRRGGTGGQDWAQRSSSTYDQGLTVRLLQSIGG